MVKNYLKLAWRNLLKHKVISLINILGLAIGLAACLIIFLYVEHELTYDQYNSKADRIARITSLIHAPESDLVLATAPTPLAETLRRDFPEIESAVFFDHSPGEIRKDNELIREEGFYRTGQEMFDIFDFEFIEGTSAGALTQPYSVVLTAPLAKKYFGNKSAMGRILSNAGRDFKVTGVVAERPGNSDVTITGLLSRDTPPTTEWGDFDVNTYVLFRQKRDLNSFEKKLEKISKGVIQDDFNKQGAEKYTVKLEVEPLSAVHFSKGKLADTPKGNKQSTYIFSVLAVFILVIALLNYINLATARSVERAKEVGIRKVSGALPAQLIGQFLAESFFLISIACIVAVGLVSLGIPYLSKMMNTRLGINLGDALLFGAAAFLVTFLLAGLYPAFILSAFRPIKVLKGKFQQGTKGVLIRKTITVAQFAIAAALILGTTVIYQQMQFIGNADLGYNSKQLVSISIPRDSMLQPGVKAFIASLRDRPEINDITVGSGMDDEWITIGSTTTAGSDGKRKEVLCNYFAVDTNYINVFGLKLLEGRNFSAAYGTDKSGYVVNEAFVRSMGWKTAVGKAVEGWSGKGEVIGVVKDFSYRSLHNLVEPMILSWKSIPGGAVTLRVNPDDMSVVKDLFKTNVPSRAIQYSFYDEMLAKQYEKDRLTMSLFTNFTMLAVFICALGLYGLVTLIATQRTREIGIRKVLGASVKQLLSVLVSDFVKLLAIAILIALPVSGFFLHKWLNNYAYHESLNWWMFLVPVIFLLIISLVVISREVFRTALMNPVKSLKAE